MIKNISLISIVLSSVLFTFQSPKAVADDCSISINTKESISCLQRKVKKLEKQLEQIKRPKVFLPKGAIVDFNTKSCPSGWVRYQTDKNTTKSVKAYGHLVKCQKT